MSKKLKYFFLSFFQILWGFPQTLLGFILLLMSPKYLREYYKGSIVSRWDRFDGLSLGLFIFIPKTNIPSDDLKDNPEEQLLLHEYGHFIQSLIIGPFYLPVIGIPSAIWANSGHFKNIRKFKNKDYCEFYTEAWAERLSKRYNPIKARRKHI
ncbi:MAG: hypothetical protein GX222_01500 [Ruminococcaceae bacterium]|nr:hypothetical protein [Oscillospiraceae bacterium]